MQKAKLILAAVAVMAIAGGVFASKARVKNNFFIPAVPGGSCTVPFETTLTTTDPNSSGAFTTEYSIAATTTSCNTWVTTTN